MAGVEFLLLLFLMLKAGAGRPGTAPAPSTSSPTTAPVPTPSAPVPGPVVEPPRTVPAAVQPPSGVPATPTQARQTNQAQATPRPFPQAVPAGLPPFPGPGWKPWSPVPGAVAARANQLLPELWRVGPGTRKVEQTAGAWTTYIATPMKAANGAQLRGVTAHKLVAGAGPLANA